VLVALDYLARQRSVVLAAPHRAARLPPPRCTSRSLARSRRVSSVFSPLRSAQFCAV
jgi:hypothetical protein